LLVATATAFVVTQHLKLEPSPISQTHVDKVFSPVCECETSAAHIDFSIRRADHLRVWVRTPAGPVAIADREYPKGAVHVRWNGRNPDGAVVPDGIYYAAVHMRRAQRTIDLPNPIEVDTRRPTIRLTGVQHTGRDWTFRYVASEPAHAILFVNGSRAVFTNLKRRRGHFKWHGYLGNKLVLKPRRLVLEAEDVAGNRSLPSRIRTA
jgi:hypothetical protein